MWILISPSIVARNLAELPNIRQDPEQMFARRGAHFTFDGKAYAQFVADLDSSTTCAFPLFSHREKDPVAGGRIEANHRIVCVHFIAHPRVLWLIAPRTTLTGLLPQPHRGSVRLP